MATTIELDSKGNPIGTTVSAGDAMTHAVRFNAQTTFQSPFFWIVVGAGIAALGYYLLRRKNLI
jgi:membrane protein required for beta-lactamase induction